MNSNYFYDYVDLLNKVLSFSYQNKITPKVVERCISYSSYFEKLEKDFTGDIPIADEETLIREVFKDIEINSEINDYSECIWASEAYLRIQEETKLNFETIFIYMPLNVMYALYPLYHEMDFTQVIDLFLEAYKKESILSKLIDRFGYTVKYVSEITNISINTLYSLKQRKRDISRFNFLDIYKLANIFKVKEETLAEIKIVNI